IRLLPCLPLATSKTSIVD
ncbi:hypothetical protein AB1N83_002308, partial [Pleurotus pulmonarius]